MMVRNPSSFGVGELLFSPEFMFAPADLASWDRASVLGDHDDRPGFRPSLEGPPAASQVPEGLVVARALDALERSAQWGGCHLRETSRGRLRSLGRVGVGERLHAVASVRYRSRGRTQESFLTLNVEIRSEGRRVAEMEFGVEVLPAAAPSVIKRPSPAPFATQAA